MPNNTPSQHDLTELMDPISASKTCGESLRYTDVYDQIRESRREEDKTLPQGVWKSEVKSADWDKVSKLCQDALKTRSKDLQVAAWLTEAWLHMDGVNGLTKGLELILGLSEIFWKDLFPQINEKGFELRIVPFDWINTRISEEIASIKISAPSDHTAFSYQFIDYTEANLRQFSPKGTPQKSSKEENTDSAVSLSKVSLSIDQTPTPFYRYMSEGCNQALKATSDLEDVLRLQLEEAAPAFYRLREKIEGLKRFANHILDERGEKVDSTKKVTKEPVLKKSTPHKGPIETREQAYALLGEVAGYLERVEPHSPTPYLIQRAIAWGGMTLPEVVENTLQNGHDMSLLLDILNVKKKSEAS